MSLDRDNRKNSEQFANRESLIRRAGTLLADHLMSEPDPTLLLDMDGVLFDSDSIHSPRLFSLDAITTLQAIENQGVKIGPATGRGNHIIDYLRGQGLQLAGPAILEEGQVTVSGDETSYLGHPNHRAYMATMKEVMSKHPQFVLSWDEAKARNNNGEFAFCLGNYQWLGDCRTSFWFPYQGEQEQDRRLFAERVEPVLKGVSDHHDLDYDVDVAVSVSRRLPSPVHGNLGIISIKGTEDGNLIHKGKAAEGLPGTWGFVADGFGDATIAAVTKGRNGVVIGIEGNMDMTPDAAEFMQTADIILSHPKDFTQALRHTAVALKRG